MSCFQGLHKKFEAAKIDLFIEVSRLERFHCIAAVLAVLCCAHLDVGTILWPAVHAALLLHDCKLKAKVVDGNGVLASIVLQHS